MPDLARPEEQPRDTLPSVSVCMATYNGMAYVGEQMVSILEQLGPSDEVVVVDDGSTDGTLEVIADLADERIRVLRSAANLGSVRAFERALETAHGRYLLLADQDDVWLPGRVAAMVAALHDVQVVATNLATLGGPPTLRGPLGQQDWRLRPADSRRHVRNIVGVLAGNRPYYGCAMGVRPGQPASGAALSELPPRVARPLARPARQRGREHPAP